MEFWITVIAVAIACMIHHRVMLYFGHTDGTLKIDTSNPEKDSYMFYIDDIEALSKKKRLIIRVDSSRD